MKLILPIIFTLLSINSFSQIVYTDLAPNNWQVSVTPTTLISHGDETRIDLNNDGVDDYYFRLDFSDFDSWWWCHLDSDFPNEVIAQYPLDGVSPFPIPFSTMLDTGETIDSTAVWGDVSLNVNAVFGLRQNTVNVNQPHLMNTGDQFIGLRFTIGTEKHYAWMKVNAVVNNDSMSVTIKEYAFQSSPNTPIIVGDRGTTSLFNKTIKSSLKVYPNPAINTININKYIIDLGIQSYSIINLIGQEVVSGKLYNSKISIDMLSKGNYIIVLVDNENNTYRSSFIKL